MTAQPVAMARGWVPTDDTFATRLAMIRNRMGWSNINEAAFACGIPQESWRDWECRGRSPRRLDVVSEKIAAATRQVDGVGVDPDWLMRGTRRPGPMDGCTVRDSNPEPADSCTSPGQLVLLTTEWSPLDHEKITHTADAGDRPSGSICHIPDTVPA